MKNPGFIVFVSLFFLLGLGGCAPFSAKPEPPRVYPTRMVMMEKPLFEGFAGSPARKAIRFIEEGRLRQATEDLNDALRKDFTNSSLQLLNGINYHLRALGGDGGLFDLAEQGYMAAIRFDRSNWAARFYLGLLYIDMRHYKKARRQLGQYVYQNDADPEALYYLAIASYYVGDPVTAHSAAMRLWDLSEIQKAPDIEPQALLRLLTMVKAAVDKPEEAEVFLDKYLAEKNSQDRAEELHRRLEGWKYFFKKQQENTSDLAAGDETGTEEFETPDETEAGTYGSEETDETDSSESEFVENEMVAVDVVIIRSEEDVMNSYGVNLLKGLQLQFGNTLDGTNAFTSARNKVTDLNNPDNNDWQRTITSAITVPAVTYTLNIANTLFGQNEILARPTLVARSGQTSEFFSGVEVSAAAVSGGAGDSVSIEKEIGVKLAITPEIGPDDTVILQVNAERTFLTQPSSSVVFEFRLDTSKTTVNANVAMKFGQTLILSGLSERETENNVDGVPGLKNVPGVNMAFSRRTNRKFTKSVLILVTPHHAQYLYKRPDGILTVGRLKKDRIIADLADRYQTWFRPIPNVQVTINKLMAGKLYQEFQSGDMPYNAWYKSNSHKHRLAPVIDRISL
jgi:general secretion pathway protein D